MVATLDAFRAAIPWAVARCQYNLLGSHDTAAASGPWCGDPGRLRAAFGLLFGYVGVPSILYGDEVGLEGDDGLTRADATMPWDAAAWDLDHLEFVRALVRFRVRSRRPRRPAASRSSRPATTRSPSCATRTTSR